ncbi:hypothetical protein F5884DRAFT_87245 [Xylogone sp. PMI_703]|nr:hypothetical protein F5884DRAFT_87245 [Xylogone sp. PMI_703]
MSVQDNVGIAIFATGGTLVFLAVLITALRCYTRIVLVKAFGLDDWLMLLSLAFYIVFMCWGIRGKTIDFGKPTAEIPLTDIPKALFSFYFAEIFYILTTFTLKLSLAAFLLRIIKVRAQVIAVHVMLVLITILSIIFFFMTIFQCQPAEKFWHPEVPGKCFGKTTVLGISLSHGILIAITDFLMAILPLFIVWKLQMTLFMKFSVAALMGMGSVAGISSVIRLPYVRTLVYTDGNFFQATSNLAIVSCIEPGLGIIIGSASALRPLFVSIFGKSRIGSSLSLKTRSRNQTNPNSTHRSNTRMATLISKNRDIETGRSHRLDSLDSSLDGGLRPSHDGKGFGTVMICEGGVGSSSGNGSQEALTPGSDGNTSNAHAPRRIPSARGIYKDTTVERTVEFARRDT